MRLVFSAFKCAAIIGVALSGAPITWAKDASLDKTSEIAPFAAELARAHGLEPATVHATLSQARVLDKVLKAISRPAEGKPWKDYRKIFMTEKRIADGAQYWRAHVDTLRSASDKYGVPARVMVAIIGVETLYGQRAGNIRVLDALATLGFRYPPRAEFFRRELGHFLILAKEERLDALGIEGSYAGAMGIGQFIPSSYRQYAVDFDGDGRRDLLGSHSDAIGSVASYLARHGWQRGQPVTVRASVSGDAIQAIIDKGVKPHQPLAALRQAGVAVNDDVSGSPNAALIDLDGAKGTEHWVIFQNFYSITRYNHSKLYAMAVHQLSQAIERRYQASAQ